jgi:hypothetical protein
MILGVDHIALSTDDVNRGVELIGKTGFKTKFIDNGIPNLPAKRDFLKLYRPTHSIAYCQSESGVSIELTQHELPLQGVHSAYEILLDTSPVDSVFFTGSPPPDYKNVWSASLGCGQPVMKMWPSFHTFFWCDTQNNGISSALIRALLVPVTDMPVSEAFWVKGLGCNVIARGVTDGGSNWTHIIFRTPVPAWSLDVILAQSEQVSEPPYLDEPGFPCLALISNSLSKDKEKARSTGARKVSDEFKLEVGGKLLTIVLLRGPDNEIVELIDFSA